MFKREEIFKQDKKGLSNLLKYVNETRGIDFSLYRNATVKRKIELRLEETDSKNYEDYLLYLRSNPEEIDKIIRDLTIKFSNFFRNPLVYELLYSNVLPELIAEFRFLKAWSIGCANGEEPYSLAIITNDLLKKERDFFDVAITGSDIDCNAIEKGMKGEFPNTDLAEVKKKYIDSCFKQIPDVLGQYTQEHVYSINEEIRSLVKLNCYDIVSHFKEKKAFPDAFNIILCRNVLIYMNRALQEEVYQGIAERIYENGYLVIGETETLPETVRSRFDQVFPGVKIFKKKGSKG